MGGSNLAVRTWDASLAQGLCNQPLQSTLVRDYPVLTAAWIPPTATGGTNRVDGAGSSKYSTQSGNSGAVGGFTSSKDKDISIDAGYSLMIGGGGASPSGVTSFIGIPIYELSCY